MCQDGSNWMRNGPLRVFMKPPLSTVWWFRCTTWRFQAHRNRARNSLFAIQRHRTRARVSRVAASPRASLPVLHPIRPSCGYTILATTLSFHQLAQHQCEPRFWYAALELCPCCVDWEAFGRIRKRALVSWVGIVRGTEEIIMCRVFASICPHWWPTAPKYIVNLETRKQSVWSVRKCVLEGGPALVPTFPYRLVAAG